MDERLEMYLTRFNSRLTKLRGYTSAMTPEQLAWVPQGIANSTAWILRHCAELCWLPYGAISGDTIPVRPATNSLPPKFVEAVRWTEGANEPSLTADALLAGLDIAFETLRSFLSDEFPTWMQHRVVIGEEERTSWWVLELCMVDAAHHEGQADYLRRIMPDPAAFGAGASGVAEWVVQPAR